MQVITYNRHGKVCHLVLH